MKDNLICILARNFIPGKSELERHLGNKKTALLSRAFLLDTLSSALRVPRCEVALAYWPAESRAACEEIISQFEEEESDKKIASKVKGIELTTSPEEKPDKRLCDLSGRLFEKGARRILFVSPNSPLVDPMIFRASLELLKQHNVVMGPTFDGTYYLLGTDNHYHELYAGVDWEKPNIYRQIVDRVTALKLKWQELEISYDVERLDELEQLYCDIDNLRLAGKENICQHTQKCLSGLKR